jgi:ankyrin repeat protein
MAVVGAGGGGEYPQLAKAFLTACRKGKLADVTQLLGEGNASWVHRLLKQRDLDGYTGLHKAAYNGHLAVVTLLLGR